MKKKLPIGYDDFREIVIDDFYYVDKSLFIKELLENRSKVILIPRPRRFGKTLNLSMLKYFLKNL
jgi:Predicted AAA-ATPase.